LAGKIMYDRGHTGFRTIRETPQADVLLAKVEQHYRDTRPVINEPEVQKLVVTRMWESIGFENLSVEILAYVWEKTLVSEEIRERLSIHATPPNVARYIVNRLRIDSISEPDRRVVEPCCGSNCR
jgi:hypothetical protein